MEVEVEVEACWSLILPDNGFFAGARNDLILQAALRRFFQPIKTFNTAKACPLSASAFLLTIR